MFFKKSTANILKGFLFSCLFKLFGLLRPTARFKLALRLARWGGPLIKAAGYFPMPAFASGNYREFLTAGFLQSLTNRGAEFDAVIEVRGAELIPEKGAILLSGHFYLNFVFLRWLHDNERAHSVFLATGTDRWPILGTNTELKRLLPGNISLVRVKQLLSEGEIVIAAIDDCEHHPNWTKLEIAGREIYISDALIRFAERSGTPVFFFDTYFESNYKIVTEIVRPSLAEHATIVDDFEPFIRNAMNKRNTV